MKKGQSFTILKTTYVAFDIETSGIRHPYFEKWKSIAFTDSSGHTSVCLSTKARFELDDFQMGT